METFFPDFKTHICNKDHTMLINLLESSIDSHHNKAFFVTLITFKISDGVNTYFFIYLDIIELMQRGKSLIFELFFL
ncbi:hypothetical protein EGK65_22740 [Citrobacter farmeri]|nr:hypothetical protein EGK65_22740 [Citrobacter farmeri]